MSSGSENLNLEVPGTPFWHTRGSLWHHFGTLGDHFGSIWAPSETTLGSFGRFWATGSNLDQFPEKKVGHLRPCWTPKSKKVGQKLKKTGSGKQRREKMLPELSQSGPMCDLYNKNHMFRGVKEHPFGWLLVSFWLPFGVTFGHFFRKNGD